MIELTPDEVSEILAYLFGSFCIGWTVGYLISAYKSFMQKIAS